MMANPLPEHERTGFGEEDRDLCEQPRLNVAFALELPRAETGSILATVVAGSALRGHVRTGSTQSPGSQKQLRYPLDSVMIVTAALAR